jgi:hypothetical protein
MNILNNTQGSTSSSYTFNTTPRNPGPGFRDFLDSNTLIAKLAFLFMVLFVFIILLKLGISLITYFFENPGILHFMNGMVSGKQMQVFSQDPSSHNAKTVIRSTNAPNGIEFTWSSWIYIEDLQYLKGQYRHIFSKGNADVKENGIAFPNNAPGMYITPIKNELLVIMNTFDLMNEEILVPDIPLNKWLNIIIRCQNKQLDVYINGTITRSVKLIGVPKQNYGDVYVGLNGGFDGYVSNLTYYNYALGTLKISNIVNAGPNTHMVGSSMNQKIFNYLSMRWYFDGAGDLFNPKKSVDYNVR